MRPRSINLFATAYMAQALLTVIHLGFLPGQLQTSIDEMQLGADGELQLYIVLVGRLVIAGFLVWLVWARASRIAKWIVVVMVLGRVFQLSDAWQGLSSGNIVSMVWTAEFGLGLFAIACLFLPESRYWFATKGRSVKADATVFE